MAKPYKSGNSGQKAAESLVYQALQGFFGFWKSHGKMRALRGQIHCQKTTKKLHLLSEY
ncbi:MAG: hypothetical protein MJ177_10070 [Clostridia bacterium]|nr:hypothetical protein [Clostridia bacterium]